MPDPSQQAGDRGWPGTLGEVSRGAHDPSAAIPPTASLSAARRASTARPAGGQEASVPYFDAHTRSPEHADPDGSARGRRSARLELAPAQALPLDPVDVGRYAVEGEIGRGGLGRVLSATDARLRRRVAIKELLADSEVAEARFQREARVTACLEHPAIIPVYDAGRWGDGRSFYAMKLVSGRTLRDAIDAVSAESGTDAAPGRSALAHRPRQARERELDQRLALLPRVLAVADAIAYAHSRRIIHRDLKPANILLGEFGETIVADWGLAKTLDEPLGLADGLSPLSGTRDQETAAGAVLGTPAYMPPEQAAGRAVDERADVYALGAILYYLLRGAPPYAGRNAAEVVERVLAGPPPALDRARVPRDLATVVEKAMAREPAERYPTARELAEDLRRYQTGQMVSAHVYSPAARLARWIRRHRAAVGVGAALGLALVATIAIGFERVVQERNVAEDRNRRLTLVQARTALERDPTAALAWLKTYPIALGDEAAVRSIAADAWSQGVARHVLRIGDKIEQAEFSPDGGFVFTASSRKLEIWDAATGARLRADPLEDSSNFVVSPDGRRVVLMNKKGRVLVYPGVDAVAHRALDGAAPRLLGAHDGGVQALTMLANGDVVSAGLDGTLRLWTMAGGGRLLGKLPRPFVTIEDAPGGEAVVSASQDGRIRVWTIDQGEPRVLSGHDGPHTFCRWSRDGRFIAAAGAAGEVVLWDARALDAPPRILTGPAHPVIRLEIAPDGSQLAGALKDGGLWVWDLATGTGRAFSGHTDEILGLQFSRDGRLLLTGGLDRTARLWDVARGDSRVLRGHESLLDSVALSPDGAWVVTASQDMTARIWSTDQGGIRRFAGHGDDIYTVRFADDGRTVLSGGKDRTVRLWDRRSGASQALTGPESIVSQAVLSPDGRWLAASSGYGVDLRVWPVDATRTADPTAGRVLAGHHAAVWRVVFSPASDALISTSADGAVLIWDTATWQSRLLTRHEGGANFADISSDGRLVASGGEDGMLRVTDVRTLESRAFAGHKGMVHRVLFTPDARAVLTSSFDGTVRVWDLATGAARVLQADAGRVRALAVSPDGRSAASGHDDGSVRLWDLATGDGRVLGRHDAYVRVLAFSPDGRWIVSDGWDRTVRLFDSRAGVLRGLERHEKIAIFMSVSPDAGGEPPAGEVVTGGYEKVVELTSLAALATLPARGDRLPAWLAGATTAVLTGEAQLASPAEGAPPAAR